jgi:hypothetical protein
MELGEKGQAIRHFDVRILTPPPDPDAVISQILPKIEAVAAPNGHTLEGNLTGIDAWKALADARSKVRSANRYMVKGCY